MPLVLIHEGRKLAADAKMFRRANHEVQLAFAPRMLANATALERHMEAAIRHSNSHDNELQKLRDDILHIGINSVRAIMAQFKLLREELPPLIPRLSTTIRPDREAVDITEGRRLMEAE